MARKTLTVTIDSPGRDFGRVFKITEMPASQAEKWAARAFLAMARNGIEIPEDIASSGLAGIAAMGLKAIGGMRFEDAEPLLNEMFGCVAIQPDASRPAVVRSLVEDDIEEVSTRLRLRKEIFQLHTGFFPFAAPSTSTTLTAAGNSPAT